VANQLAPARHLPENTTNHLQGCLLLSTIKGRQGDWLIAQDSPKSVTEIPPKVFTENTRVKVNFSGSAILCQPRTAGTTLSDPVGCPHSAVWRGTLKS